MIHDILLVDDVRSNVQILHRMLKELGHNIEVAYSGEEALALADKFTFSVVLLDVKMPEMDGFTCARRLRDSTRSNRSPVIFVTASALDISNVSDGYSAGGVDYLIKPIDPVILRRKVEVFCELQEKERQIAQQLRRIEKQNRLLETQLEELRELEEARMESEIRYRSLVSLSPQAIVVQVAGELVFYNTRATQILGAIDDTSIYSRPFHTFVEERDRTRVMEWLEQIERQGGRGEPIECELQPGSDGNRHRHVELHACCILYDNVTGVQMAIQDITDHKLLEERLQRLSQLDGLTGGWNRRYLDEQLAHEWSRLSRSEKPLSLLMLDLDKFKNYNDSYGHLEGDACLKAVAGMMKHAFSRPADTVARYGGEEFVVLLPETNASGALHIAEQLTAAIRGLNRIHEHNRGHGVVTISCGVATMQPVEAMVPQRLIAAADKALYVVKQRGGNGVSVTEIDGN